MKYLVLVSLLSLCTWVHGINRNADLRHHVSIATGNETGVYFPAGGAICRLTNKTLKQNGFRCLVESTEGSTYNLQALREGAVDFAVVQSDWQYHAYNGSSIFSEQGPHKELRSVLSLHSEAFTVLVSEVSGITQFADIKGRRVNVGATGSGQRGTMEILLQAYGWGLSDFSEASEIKAIDQPRALCFGDIDVMLYIVGHPSGAIKEATTLCNTRLLEVKGNIIDQLVKGNSFYHRSLIPAGMYRNNPDSVETFGVGATLVTVSSLPDHVVYAVVKAVLENLDQFKKLHPALAELKKENMVFDSLIAPLHPGAKKYFRQKDLLN